MSRPVTRLTFAGKTKDDRSEIIFSISGCRLFSRPQFLGTCALLNFIIGKGLQRDVVNSALVYDSRSGGRGVVAGSQPISTAVHMEPT
jgi:hypothetical protein